MGDPAWFSTVYVLSGIWQGAGWGTIIYLAALSSVDPNLHEAAIIDGCGRFQRVIHIDLPTIMPTIVMLLILNFGRLMSVGFEKVLLMQNPLNLQSSEIITTFSYKIAFKSQLPNYSYSAAIGLFNSVANFLLLIIVNKVAKKLSGTSLW
jgi:putative aldouronate transport system permease protein